MVEVLLWALLGLIVAFIAVISIPIDLAARVDVRDGIRGSLRVGWLFGVVKVRHELRDRARKSPDETKPRTKERGGRTPPVAVIRRGLRLIGELLGRVRVRHATLDLSVGGDDPAATGELAGFAAPFVALANALPKTHVTFRPDFRGAGLEGMGEGAVRLVPIRLVPPIVRFALSPEVRQWRRNRE